MKLPTDMPARIANRPRSPEGLPIGWYNGPPDADGNIRLGLVRPGAQAEAIRRRICWICGHQLGRHAGFVLHPVAVVTHMTLQPPSHRACAVFAAETAELYWEAGIKARGEGTPAGHMPDMLVVWVTDDYRYGVYGAKTAYRLGQPNEVGWFVHGEPANQDAAMHALSDALGPLVAAAAEEGEQALQDLNDAIAASVSFLPPQFHDAQFVDPAQSAPIGDDVPLTIEHKTADE